MEIALAGGQKVVFEIQPSLDKPPTFVLGVRKSGSSILNSMCNALAVANGYPYVDVGGVFFDKNIVGRFWRNDPAVLKILMQGVAYGGFRDMPLIFAQSRLFQTSKKVLLVRDPRDALVSEYYSNAFSHRLPESNAAEGDVAKMLLQMRQMALIQEINEAVLARAGDLQRTLIEFTAVAAHPLTLVFKYEDVILNKRQLIKDILDHFGWSCDPRLVDQILGWADVVPKEENPTAFIRKVLPGDHKNKLTPETISKLNELLQPALKIFGYQ